MTQHTDPSNTESILRNAINELWRLESGPLFHSKLNGEAMSIRLRLANFLDDYLAKNELEEPPHAK